MNLLAWLSDLHLFIEEIETNFRTYNPISKAEAELKGLCMQENHQATKYFIKFQQLATFVQWYEAALHRFTIVLPKVPKTIWFTSQILFWSLETHSSYQCMILGMMWRGIP